MKAGNTYHSCCVVVKNMHRCVYAIPNSSIFHTDEMSMLEKEVEESRISSTDFHKKLQVSTFSYTNVSTYTCLNYGTSVLYYGTNIFVFYFLAAFNAFMQFSSAGHGI